MMLQVDTIRSLQEWSNYFEEWNAMAGGRFMSRSEWLASWWQSYSLEEKSRDHSLFVLRLSENGSTVGFAPLFIQRSPIYGRELMWLGSGKACSDNNTFLYLEGREAECSQSIANFLFSSGQDGTWDRLHWDGIQLSNQGMVGLGQALDRHGISVLSKPGPDCWEAPMPKNWDTYLAGLSKRSRRILRTQEKQFLKSGIGRVWSPSSLEEVDQQFDAIERIHQERWEDRSIQGCFSDATFSNFLRKATREFFEAGSLYMALLEIHNEVAAGVIGFWEKDRLSLYLVGMSPKFAEDRPGWTLNVSTLQKAIERGVGTVDFLRGDEPYKARLGAIPTPQVRWLASAPRTIPRLRHAAYRAGSWLKMQWQPRPLVAICPEPGDA